MLCSQGPSDESKCPPTTSPLVEQTLDGCNTDKREITANNRLKGGTRRSVCRRVSRLADETGLNRFPAIDIELDLNGCNTISLHAQTHAGVLFHPQATSGPRQRQLLRDYVVEVSGLWPGFPVAVGRRQRSVEARPFANATSEVNS